jgi:cholesterol oxidase
MTEKAYQRIFLVGAFWNLLGAGLFFLFWRRAFDLFQLPPPNYLAFFQAWLALAFVFGIGYYYVSRDLYGNVNIVRLGIYGKTAFEGGYRVTYRDLRAGETATVVGRRVVVAAGILGSTELLLRCREVDHTLPRLSSMLDHRFSGNGDFILAGTHRTRRDVNPSEGPSITAGVDFSTDDYRIFVEDLGFPEPLLWYLERALPPFDRLTSVFKFIKTYVRRSLGLAPPGPRGGMAAELLQGGITTQFLPYLGIGTDAADGQIRLQHGQLDVAWRVRRSRAMFRQMEQAMRALSRGIGGEYRTSLLWIWPFRKLLTAHPLGGCPMGDDPHTSVVKHTGEVWGYDGLSVVDGSVMPTALGVNPSMTIGALAERAAFWMIHGREMTMGDSQTPRDRRRTLS